MSPRIAWTLQDVAACRAGRPPSLRREDPVAFAYLLRDAIALAEPDVIVSHEDPELEADALARIVQDGEGDWVDRLMDGAPVAQTVPAAAAVTLVATLAGLPGFAGRVAVTVSGPARVATRLAGTLGPHGYAEDADAEELADLVADALGGLVTAYAAAGATTIVVLEDTGAAPDALGPLRRAADHARVELVERGAATVLPAAVWTAEAGQFTAALAAAPTGRLLLSDGPVPGDVDPARLRSARACLG